MVSTPIHSRYISSLWQSIRCDMLYCITIPVPIVSSPLFFIAMRTSTSIDWSTIFLMKVGSVGIDCSTKLSVRSFLHWLFEVSTSWKCTRNIPSTKNQNIWYRLLCSVISGRVVVVRVFFLRNKSADSSQLFAFFCRFQRILQSDIHNIGMEHVRPQTTTIIPLPFSLQRL